MDNLLDRFGIYDFFGLLIPGMFFEGFWCVINFKIETLIKCPNSDVIKITFFILSSYILGVIMQEISSLFDEKLIKLREKARKNFLNNGKFNDSESLKIKKWVNIVLNENEKYIPNEDDCEHAFYICKAYLENNAKIAKAEKINAMFSMSRGFVACNVLLLIYVLIKICLRKIDFGVSIIMSIYLGLSSILFYHRAKRFSELRTRTILRQYIDMKEQESNQ